MGLNDFEKELAASKAKDSKKRHRSRSRDRHRSSKDKDREHRHHHSSRHHRSKDHDESRSRHEPKRSRKHEARSSRKHSQSPSPSAGDDVVLPSEDVLDTRLADAADADLQRDSWMQAPSAMDVDYVQRKQKTTQPTNVGAKQADYQLKIHQNELNHHLRDLQEDGSEEQEDTNSNEEPPERVVNYVFGDAGSQWRMTKLKAVYRQAEESGLPLENLALERYGDLREFDEAREEEIEVDRRKMYGRDYKGKEKPSGDLFRQRVEDHKRNMPPPPPQNKRYIPQEQEVEITRTVPTLDQTGLNKLKAQMMKAKLKGAPNAAHLEKEYNEAAIASANGPSQDVVVLGAMDNRMLAGGRTGEVKHIDNKRGRERGTVVENEDMSIEDMVRQEKRTRGQAGGEGLLLAEKIAKDAKFDNDLDYLDENATRLATRAPKSETNLRNHAITAHQRQNRILDNCPLCSHEDNGTGPLAPVISLATRVFLTLQTEPEMSEGGAVIVPTQHRTNLLECDDDEWEEIRNFMKCLIRMYHDQGRDVVFYENAAAPQRGLHAAMVAVPVPYELGETAPAFFREAILSSDEEWTQHRKLIDTLKASKNGLGKLAFRRTLAKEMPYFHVWFELDGGMGHIVEDSNRWPKGDLFAREVFGGMLDVAPDVIKRQGRWVKGDRRAEGFKKRWRKFDWTRVLADS